MYKSITVQKANHITMLRDGLGYPYKDGVLSLIETTHVRRMLKSGDLLLVKSTKLKTEQKEGNHDNS